MPKSYELTFFSISVDMVSYKLYFFCNNSPLHGHENLRTLVFEVIDFEPEKNRK